MHSILNLENLEIQSLEFSSKYMKSFLRKVQLFSRCKEKVVDSSVNENIRDSLDHLEKYCANFTHCELHFEDLDNFMQIIIGKWQIGLDKFFNALPEKCFYINLDAEDFAEICPDFFSHLYVLNCAKIQIKVPDKFPENFPTESVTNWLQLTSNQNKWKHLVIKTDNNMQRRTDEAIDELIRKAIEKIKAKSTDSRSNFVIDVHFLLNLEPFETETMSLKMQKYGKGQQYFWRMTKCTNKSMMIAMEGGDLDCQEHGADSVLVHIGLFS